MFLSTVFLCSVLSCHYNLRIMYSGYALRCLYTAAQAPLQHHGRRGGEMHDGYLFTRAGYCLQFTANTFNIPVRIAISPCVEPRRSPSICAVSGHSSTGRKMTVLLPSTTYAAPKGHP